MPTQISIDDLTPSLATTISEAGATVTISSIQITDSGGNVLDDTAVNTSGGYIKINGTSFTGGASIIIGSTVATSITYVSPTVYLAQVPAQTAGSYTVYLVASDGATATRPLGLTYSGTPSWVTSTTLTAADSGTAYSNQLNATGATSYALAAGSTLPTGLTLSSSGLLSGTVTVGSSTTYNFTINAIDAELQDSPRTFTLDVISNVVGQVAYTTPGTYSWTAPAGVTSVSVLAVGGGGSGGSQVFPKTGGGGGGLGWKNAIPVVPGQSYTVVVGVGGPNGSSGPGGNSYFINTSTVAGLGGAGGDTGGGGGGFAGDGGASGGNGGVPILSTNFSGGGGGAGGYRTRTVATSGNGGTDGTNTGVAGEFGGGGGGGASTRTGAPTGFSGPGGGVGIFGEGASGAGGITVPYGTGTAGTAGSGGDGILYGGGGQTRIGDSSTEPGGRGAVRLIWGAGRAFPSTLTTDQ